MMNSHYGDYTANHRILLHYFNLILIIFICVFTSSSKAQTKKTTLSELHNKYSGKWPKTMTYIENQSGTRANESWTSRNYYAASFPDLFRKDLENIDDGNAEIIADGTMHRFRKYKKFDQFTNNEIYFIDYIVGHIYFDALEKVTSRFTKEGIAADQTFSRTWKGKKVISIGSSTADTTVSQIWYDAVELFPVRALLRSGKNMEDYHFINEKVQGSWFPREIKYFRNKRLRAHLTYEQVKRNMVLDPEIFSIENFGSAHWYKSQE